MPPKAAPTPIKASESVVCRILAKMLGVTAHDTLEEVCYEYSQSTSMNTGVAVILSRIHGLYPWIADVATDVMSSRTTPLSEHLLSLPGSLHVAKDSARAGPDSIWLVVADPPTEIMQTIRQMECRGLFHTFKVGGERSMILAVQLSSCRP